MNNWTISYEEVCELSLDKPNSGQNVLSEEILQELSAAIDEIIEENPKGLIISSAKSNGFIAGADVSEFSKVESVEQAKAFVKFAHDIFNKIEQVKFPTVAMINGHCLGGGLELALACDYRVVCEEPTTRLGLPEVMLGIHPGFGGTVRLIEKTGVTTAMDLMLSGRTVIPKVAKKLGIVDLAVPMRQLRRGAEHLIQTKPKSRKVKRLQRMLGFSPVRPILANILTKKVSGRANIAHYPAPFSIIDLWKQHGGNRKNMLIHEQASVAELITTPTAKNLSKVFFLQEHLKGLGKSNADTNETTIFDRVHVVGAGVMGGDIASWCALKGLHVTIQDQNPEALGRASKRAFQLFKKKLKQPRLIQRAMDRFQPDIDGTGVTRADVIIEAIIENAEAKINLFAELEKKAKPDAILATNTSSIPLEVISNALTKPGRLVGLHFFNPVAKMQLVEIVNGEKTFSRISMQAKQFAVQIGRLPLPVKSSPGFLVNRILMPYLLEAVELHKEGVPDIVIDKVATDFGMPMGPITLADTVGLDICQHVAKNLTESFGGEIPSILAEKVESKQLGKKSGQGFYTWKKGKAVKSKADKNYTPPGDVEDRLIFRFLNEAVACLHENIVENDQQADGGLIFGTGFAPFLGGPINYIKDNGQKNMLEKLQTLHEKYGDRFTPSEGWNKLSLTGDNN